MLSRLSLHTASLLLVLMLSACQLGLPPSDATSSAEMAPVPEDVAQLDAAVAALELDEELPVAPDLRAGTLDNGLQYFVRRNTNPSNRAELWLVIDAGSVLEDEDQRGLAHFLEHMLFNGTERFPEQALIDFFETVGMTFGPDINAYTSFDETVYQIRFPLDDQEIIDTAFNVLEDWAGAALIDPREVELERGVVLEEYRLNYRNANGRILEQIWPVLLGDSRYTERRPIGLPEVIETAPPETVRRFYENWYRPDLMAVIAVGDFDVDAFEQQIIDHFSDLENPADAPPRERFSVPSHEEPRYGLVTDPELTLSLLEVTHKQESEELDTVASYRDILKSSLFQRMLNFRLEELAREADSPFLNATVEQGRLVRPLETISASAVVQDDEVLTGLEAVLTEIERVRRFGFTESELNRAQQDLLRFYERIYTDRENMDSRSMADELRRHYLEGEAVPGIPVEFALARRFIPTIELSEINSLADTFVGTDNRTVLVLGPEQEEASLPSEAEIAAVIDSIQAKAIEPYEDVEIDAELLADVPEPAEIVSSETITSVDVTAIELANGVRVLMKPTDFREEQILVSAISPGGTSLVSDEDYVEAAFVSNLVAQSGVSDYTYAELVRLLTGQSVGVGPYIRELDEGFNGSATPDGLEILLKLVYLFATAPRLDDAAVSTLQDQARASLQNRDRDPEAVLQDRYNELRFGDTVRRGVPPLSEFEQFDTERAFEIYRDRFADFGDFTFIFVGNFDVEQVTELSQIYLGNLPTTGRKETWVDVDPDPPAGIVTDAVYAGQDERSITRLVFTGELEPSLENEILLDLLSRALDIRMTETLREALGGVYAAGASSNLQEQPDPLYSFSIAFGSDPGRVTELVDAVFGLIDELQTDGPSADLLGKVKAQLLRDREEALEENGFWQAVLEEYAVAAYVLDETDADEALSQVLDLPEMIEAITAADLQEAAQRYLTTDQYILVSLYPQGFEPAE